ncbi:class I glutamine amidotransferase-like protein [Polychaeton citri CBS 116435]|uniref:Class I glutamine amidotransferase-like protein n=1 Tax=Polychaeton citri CBS 116435 TaxID=1314669 RepID=A0A9P4UMY9_9PEZI|nr:class I glutamine amidotransferase-like protein [Polychaeton citri CBS 116435]
MGPNSMILGTRQAAIVAWDGMDLTDFAGPVEAIQHASDTSQKRFFTLTIVAEKELSSTSENVHIPRHITLEEGVKGIAKYDVLLIPGGGGFTADHIPSAPAVEQMIEAFMTLPARPGQPRCIMSICAGSCFLARAGLLKGKVATSHPLTLPEIQKYCDRTNGQGSTKIVRQHYVDAGVSENGTVIITTGGITSGFDGALYVIEVFCGLDVAQKAQWIMDSAWRREALPFGFAA